MSPLLLCRFAQTSAAVLLAGTAVLRLLARGTAAPAGVPRWNRLAAGSWIVLLAAGLLELWFTAAEMSGQPLARALSGETLRGVIGGTRFGMVWTVRAGLLVGMFVARWGIAAAQRRRGQRREPNVWGDIAGALLAAALLVSLVWNGHAAASARYAWLLPVDGLHAVTAGAWPGGLLPLALLLARVRREPTLAWPAVIITRRFSRLSLVAVSILVFTGLLNGWGLVGTFSTLWTRAYGRLLLCKVTLLLGMISFGAVNHRLISRHAPAGAAQTLRWLWRNVAWECVLAVAVLLATEALAMNAPPMSEQ